MPHTLDAAAVRTWCTLALDALGRAREEIDAINVYPVPDGDTGTNLYLTVESAAEAVEAVCAGEATPTQAVRAMAHGALIGARGNSGTILAQLLQGMAEVWAAEEPAERTEGPRQADGEERPKDAEALRRALHRATASAYEAVEHPVEGSMLTVAAAAADAAAGTDGAAGAAEVALAAYASARRALAATPGQLDVLGRAGVVDAGGSGLVTVLGALADALSGSGGDGLRVGAVSATEVPELLRPGPSGAPAGALANGGPQAAPASVTAYEVIYLLDADDAAVHSLREELDILGDSLVVGGGGGLWSVHVHVDDAGAAVEAGVRAGRPHRIRITHLDVPAVAVSACGNTCTDEAARGRPPQSATAKGAHRAVVAVVPGDGLAGLCAEAGATVVTVRPGEALGSDELTAAVHRARARAREIVLLPNDAVLRHTAAAVAERAREEGLRVAVIPTRSPVQGIAALAVHEPGLRFDEDVVAMTSAAGTTRYAELTVAQWQSVTTVGICQAGDVLGLVDGDVAVIGDDLARTATSVLDRMLAGGGELVTLVLGAQAPPGLGELLDAHVRRGHLAVDTVVYEGGQAAPLLIGVE